MPTSASAASSRSAGVVTVVDAKYIAMRLEESAEACEQIAFADLIVLNKTDLLDAGEAGSKPSSRSAD